MTATADYPDALPSEVPAGRVLVHNNVRPARRQATRGFRFWLDDPDPRWEVCQCGWAHELPEHYRVASRWK